LRNPWGHKEWQGDWSDNSAKWTPELREKLSVTDEDDGTFYMCYNDYINFYRSTTICKVRDEYHFTELKVNSDKYFMSKLTLKEKTDLTLSLS
jgi:calpain-15